MSDFRIDKITNRVGDAGTQIAGITTFSGTSGMQLPVGPTEYRGGRGRGVINGGSSSRDYQKAINYITIATTGSAIDFGDPYAKNGFSSGMGSSTRGIFKVGRGPSYTSRLDYVTFSSAGGIAEFGTDTGISQDSCASFADSTRGCWGNGTGYDRKIQYITMASTGDSTEFGELTGGRYQGGGSGGASPTRGFVFGGLSQPGVGLNPLGEKVIDYVTIQSKGNAVKFGELTVGRRAIAAVTNSTRAVACSGDTPGTSTMDYITMASEGNAVTFGDITRQPSGYGAGMSNSTRGVIAGCDTSPKDSIDYITFSTTGNATDFGDTTYDSYLCGACSDSHGGLG